MAIGEKRTFPTLKGYRSQGMFKRQLRTVASSPCESLEQKVLKIAHTWIALNLGCGIEAATQCNRIEDDQHWKVSVKSHNGEINGVLAVDLSHVTCTWTPAR